MMLKKIIYIFLTILTFSGLGGLLSFDFDTQLKSLNVIVLDAGHGGKDPGARGSFANEKDVTLQVILKLGNLISKGMPRTKVVYTRTDDVYPTLIERHQIANDSKGELFISVHANSTAGSYSRVLAGSKKVKKGKKWISVPVYKTIHNRHSNKKGTETYVLGLHRNDQKEGAITDNSEQINDEVGTMNPNDPMTSIIVAQYSQAFLEHSIQLGAFIENEFALQGRNSGGVKQKGLEVLAGSAMPGVLVEIGFINNLEEEAYITSDPGQWDIANSIYKGIQSYVAYINTKKKK